MRNQVAGLLVGMSVLVLASPAHAIVGGAVDGDQHPNVGILVGVDLRPGGYIGLYSCSGTLVAPDKFLTNAHCLPGGLPFAEELVAEGFAVDELRISFAGSFAQGEDLLGPVPDVTPFITARSWVANPGYSSAPGRPDSYEAFANDLGVVTLSRPAAKVFEQARPATLAPAGYLSKVDKREYTLVGYGQGITFPPLKDDRFFDATRRMASSREDWATTTLIQLRGVPQSGSAEDSGTACSGDSGGAILHGPYLVGVIAGSDVACHKVSLGPLLDGPIARAFLSSLHLLP